MTFAAQPFPMAAFENGMLWRLKQANAAQVEGAPLLGYVLRSIDNYSGQLETPEILATAIGNLPAVWACFEEASYNEASGAYDATFSVLCLAGNARNEKAARHGAGPVPGGGEVGVYQIARDVAGLLDGFACNVPSATALRCTKIAVPFNAAFQKTRLAIAMLTFAVHWDPAGYSGIAGDTPVTPGETGAQVVPGTTGDFDTFDVAWEVPPFPQPQPAPPAEGVTEPAGTYSAEDTVTVNPS